jgi:hypothetical protein
MNVREVLDRDQAWRELAPINAPVFVKSESCARKKNVYHCTSSQNYVVKCVS